MDSIRHQGKVDRIENGKVYVRIEQEAACSGCHSRSVCFAANKKEKIIEITDCSGVYSLHEDVIVTVKSSLGLFAVVVTFLIPLLLVIITLIVGLIVSGSEIIGGLTGLFVLVPYYSILYFFRDKLKRKLVFALLKN